MSRYIRTASALAAAAEELASAAEIALDTEFHVERRYAPELMLVQLRADAGEPLLVDPLAGLDLAPLGSALSGAPVVVVHGGATDLRLLRDLLGVVPPRVFDTQIAAGFAGDGYPVRLQELVRTHLGEHMGKGETLSDWSRRPLSEEQLRYAADDVLVLGRLKRALEDRVDERGYGALLAACTAEQVARAVVDPDPRDAWRTIGGAPGLDAAERSALCELAAWRERTARERDVPRNAVANDAVLLDLARRRPADAEGLRANRRMPSQLWRKDASAVLGCLAAGRRAPDPGPASQYPRGWWEVARAFARVREAETGIAAELTFPDRAPHGARVSSDDWRRTALGPAFEAFLAGAGDIRMPECWRSLPPY